MAADGASCCRSFSADLEFTGEQLLHAFVIHDQHDQVYALNTNLQTRASSTDRNESRSAPTLGCAASGYTAAVLAAEDETAFDKMRDHGNAFGIIQNFFRNAFVRGGRH